MLDNWKTRHGIWKLHKHCLPDTKDIAPFSTMQESISTSSNNSSNVIITFMHDSLELNLKLGHQITADTLPDSEIREEIIQVPNENEKTIIRRTRTSNKILHWTLLKIEFTNPSKMILRQTLQKQANSTMNGDDVRLAHYLLLRNLTPSRLADMCPTTKNLEETLSIISQVNQYL